MTRFPRDDYRALDLYAPDRRPVAVDLSDNTNRWGAHPAALAAVRAAGRRYAHPLPVPIRRRPQGCHPPALRGATRHHHDRMRLRRRARLGLPRRRTRGGHCAVRGADVLDGGDVRTHEQPHHGRGTLGTRARGARSAAPRTIPWRSTCAGPTTRRDRSRRAPGWRRCSRPRREPRGRSWCWTKLTPTSRRRASSPRRRSGRTCS